MTILILLIAVCVIAWLVRTPPGYKRPEHDWTERLADRVFGEKSHGCVTTVVILAAVYVWALILDAVFGLEALRRLLGWTLY